MPNPKTIEKLLIARETESVELPWQDISTLNDYEGDDYILCIDKEGLNIPEAYQFDINGDDNFYINAYTHWLPITPPKAPTVEAPPVEPKRVSVQDFAKNPIGKYYSINGNTYIPFIDNTRDWDELRVKTCEIIIESNCIFYESDPTEWLAHKAEQEGKSE